MSTTPAWALKRIDEARESGATTLDLDGLTEDRLDEVPAEALALSQLRRLILKRNTISSVPDLTEHLPHLQYLDLRENPLADVAGQPCLVFTYKQFTALRRVVSLTDVVGIDLEKADIKTFPFRDFAHLRMLDIQSCGMTAFPEAVLGYENLEILEISRNGLTSLPQDVRRLSRLEALYAYANQLGLFPDVVLELAGLQVLNLGANGIPAVPAEIARLSKLKELYLHENLLRDLPRTLSGLTQLELLTLGSNPLSGFPSALTGLRGLKTLRLSKCALKTIPAEVGTLKSLTELELWHNEIERIPEVVAKLRNLRVLGITENRLREIPAFVLELPRLEQLAVDGDRIENLPPEIVQGGRVDLLKARAYLRQLREQGSAYLSEAKLLVVGEGEAGKTTFVKKLLDSEYALNPQERTTEGIDVVEWRFPARIRVTEDGQPRYIDTDIEVHVWDFAGQEITYATHQFFLTKRSLYVLIIDNRRDNPNFDYWLNVIELLSDNSPLLILKNEKQDLPCTINEGAVRERFTNIKDVAAVNFANNRGLETVASSIRAQVQMLPHMGTRLPVTWKRVREALLARRENYISRDALLRICEEHGFERLEDKLQLSEYLHDLGACLHFQNDPALAGIVILRPQWATHAVYKVLRDRAVVDRFGRFHRNDLARIWAEPEYQPVRNELLELMKKFKLCYPLGEGGEHIIPQLLPLSQPTYPWDADRNLHVYYDYDFMPKGILPRLVVSLHRSIESQDRVWQQGVVLARDGARAEIVEEYQKRKIRIRVLGRQRLQLLGAITQAIGDINAVYHRLTVRKMIPCQCTVCVAAPEPFFLPADQVRHNAANGWKAMQCHRSGEMVPVDMLLQAVGEEIDRAPELESREARADAARGRESTDARRPAVFVSYAWDGESEAVVDRIETALRNRGLEIARDKKVLGYKADVSAFMSRLARGDAIIAVISDGYLRSENCMRELVEIGDNTGTRSAFADRIFPIVLEDARIYDLAERIDYVEFWEQKRNALAEKMGRIGPQHLHGFREGIDLYDRIRDTIGRLVDVLSNLNTWAPDRHRDEDFESLYSAVTRAVTRNPT